MRYLVLCLLGLLLAFPVQSQTRQPQAIRISAADGLTLVGDWTLQHPDAPTVLLLHQLYSDRTRWSPLDGALIGAGMNVLAVDLRGYGETGGDIRWQAALDDVQTWLNWLRTQGLSERISLVGSSMGSVLAVAGCANDVACRTAVAISPGWEYYGIGVRPALENGLGERRILVIYSERDRYPRLGVPRMVETAPALVELLAFSGNAHGMNLIRAEEETALPAIVDWIVQRSQ